MGGLFSNLPQKQQKRAILHTSQQGRLVMEAKKAAAYPASSVCFYYFYY